MLNGVRLILTVLIALFNGGIAYLLALGLTGSQWWGLFWTVLVIAGLFALARSKYGERYLRAMYRMRHPVGDEKSILNAAWREVCKKAGVSPDDYDLFLLPASPQDDLNAVAVGRRTVAVTPGMLKVPQEELEAVLAHELAHLAHKDSEYLLFISIVNAVGTAAVWALTSLVVFYGLVTSVFSGFSGMGEGRMAGGIGILFALLGWLLKLCAWICTKIFQIAYLGLSRQIEYRCDSCAVWWGFGPGLVNFLCRIWPLEAKRDTRVVAVLFASHPPTGERIKRVVEAIKKEGSRYAG